MAWGFLEPKRPAWFAGSLLAVVGGLATFAVWSWLRPWAPGALGGLVFGNVAAGFFYLDALYPLRRRLLAWPLRTAQQWLQFHIYGGFVASVFVVIHMGLRLPAGSFGWALLLLTLWSTVSGLTGVYLQKSVPALLANELHIEVTYERIPEIVKRLKDEADEVVKNSSEMLQRFYIAKVRGQLEHVSRSWTYTRGYRAELERRIAPFREQAQYHDADERPKLTELQTIVTERLELDVQDSLQRLLKQWVILHSVPSLLLLGLLTVHIVTVLIF